MTAILSLGIAVYRKLLMTNRANINIDRLSLDYIEMAVPPGLSASIRTEPLFLFPRNVLQCLTALLTTRCFIFEGVTEFITPAKGLYAVY